jgi:hypothetical protein
MIKRIVVISTLIAALTLGVISVSAQGESFPAIIPLPDGFRPEGVAAGNGHDLYAGSLGTGAVYGVDLRTGEYQMVVPDQEGRIAVGLKYDSRSNYLFVAGGPAGAGYVYDVESGNTVDLFQFTSEASFVNDVVVTQDAAYFTDSFRPFFYRVPLTANGQLPNPSEVEQIPLGGDFVFVPGAFNSNGIDATSNGESLFIVHSGRGELFHVDPDTGYASLIDLGGGAVPNGDGILLDGKTLYVVQNRMNKIAVVQLSPELTAGEIVREITDPNFDVPTTIAEFGNSLYAVNARFGTPPTPDTEYDIVGVTKE